MVQTIERTTMIGFKDRLVRFVEATTGAEEKCLMNTLLGSIRRVSCDSIVNLYCYR